MYIKMLILSLGGWDYKFYMSGFFVIKVYCFCSKKPVKCTSSWYRKV